MLDPSQCGKDRFDSMYDCCGAMMCLYSIVAKEFVYSFGKTYDQSEVTLSKYKTALDITAFHVTPFKDR